MGRISAPAAVVAALCLSIANAQPAPERILGTVAGEYSLFTPQAVVAAGGGGTGGTVPTPPSTGRQSLESLSGTVQWTPLNTLLEEELYDEFDTGSQLPASGHHVVIGAVDSDTDRVTLRTVAPPAGLSDIAPSPLGTTAGAGTGTAASRDSHVHLNPLTPYGTAGQCAQVNSTGDGIVYGACGSGGSGGGASLSNSVPKPLGTAAAGSGTAASRDDHVHLLPADIAANKATIATNTAAIGTNKTNIATNTSGVATNAASNTQTATVANANRNSVHALQARQNPALGSSTAGQLVRQKSDHSAYETVPAATAVLAGLPSLSSEAGKCLKANSGETALEFGECGGGDAGGSGWELFKTWDPPDNQTLANYRIRNPFTQTEREKLYVIFNAGAEWTMQYNDGNTRYVVGGFLKTSGRGFATAAAMVGNVTDGTTSGNIQFTQDSIWVETSGGGTARTVSGASLWINQGGGGGGSGGGSGPSIPAPSASTALDYLRVNSAGDAYELEDFPTIPSVPAYGTVTRTVGTETPGSSSKISREDHGHALSRNLFGTSAKPIALASSAGTGTFMSRFDHVHEFPDSLTGGKVSAVQSTLSHEGSSRNAARSDHGHALAVEAFSELNSIPSPDGLASAGQALRIARADHSHPAQSGWTQFIDDDVAAPELVKGSYVTSLTFGAILGGDVKTSILNGSARLRVTAATGSTVHYQCVITSPNNGMSYGFTSSDAATMKHCVGGFQSFVVSLIYDPDTGDGKQELDVVSTGTWRQNFTITVDVWIDPNPAAPELLWTHTATGTAWATPIALPISPASAIYARMTSQVGSADEPYKAFRVYLLWEQDGGSNPDIQHRGLVTLAGSHEPVDGTKRQEYAGKGHLHTADFTAKLLFPAGETELANLPTLALTGCSFCTGGTHNIRAQLVGVP